MAAMSSKKKKKEEVIEEESDDESSTSEEEDSESDVDPQMVSQVRNIPFLFYVYSVTLARVLKRKQNISLSSCLYFV